MSEQMLFDKGLSMFFVEMETSEVVFQLTTKHSA